MKRKKPPVWCGRLLDEWLPPPDAGAALACLATSYTFDSVFFEEQCLGRFAGIRSVGGDDDKACELIVEREEKLSQIRAAVLVDKAHCQGLRSPRWDLLCARGKGGGILHAKLSLLIWARHMRLIVASANLTESGYRRNREVFCCLEASEVEPLAAEAFRDALAFMKRLADLAGGDENPAIARWQAVIEEARSRLSLIEGGGGTASSPVSFAGIEPGGDSLFHKMEASWSPRYGTRRSISLVSPFFDREPDQAGLVAKTLWGLGAQSGQVTMQAWLPAEREGGDAGQVRLLAPEALALPPRKICEFKAMAVFAIQGEERRPLHAKALSLSSDAGELVYVGSSNMTCAGTGLGRVVNFEAGLCCALHEDKSRAAMASFWESLGGEELKEASFEGSAEDEDAAEDASLASLPTAFLYAVFRSDAGVSTLEIAIEPGPSLPGRWSMYAAEIGDVADSDSWEAEGRPTRYRFACPGTRVPSGLELRWVEDGEPRTAWLPVCVSSMKDLPPPEELRALPLDVLIDILSAARPMSHIVDAYRRSLAMKAKGDAVETNPLKRVDTSDFLIQRARRASLAISRLAERLSEPCPSREALEWRLYGPCGARAVENALEGSSRDMAEAIFHRTELYLTIKGLQFQTGSGYLGADEQRDEIRVFVENGAHAIETEDMEALGDGMKEYILKALRKLQELP